MTESPIPFPQPGLRSFIIYDELPAGCISFEIKDAENADHFSAGEFLVVDTSDRKPMHGEMFLVKLHTNRRGDDIRPLECFRRAGMYGNPAASGFAWYLGPTRRHDIKTLGGEVIVRNTRWVDGPYGSDGEGFDYLCGKLVGRIIGIYQPDFRQQMQRIAA